MGGPLAIERPDETVLLYDGKRLEARSLGNAPVLHVRDSSARARAIELPAMKGAGDVLAHDVSARQGGTQVRAEALLHVGSPGYTSPDHQTATEHIHGARFPTGSEPAR